MKNLVPLKRRVSFKFSSKVQTLFNRKLLSVAIAKEKIEEMR